MDARAWSGASLSTDGSSVSSGLVAALSSAADAEPVLLRVRREGHLFHAGDGFSAIYTVHSGSFKVVTTDGCGIEQIVDFSMLGELFGCDGIGTGRHHCTATALEDSCVTVLPFSSLEALARRSVAKQRQLLAALSLEIVRKNGMLVLLGSMTADRRLATFLVNLSQRFRQQGYSPTDFILRMTREEIGSYLGLNLETVSRSFSRFEQRGLLNVEGKHVQILQYEMLRSEAASL